MIDARAESDSIKSIKSSETLQQLRTKMDKKLDRVLFKKIDQKIEYLQENFS